MLSEGDKAPDFTLEADDGSKVTLGKKPGDWVVLYFYPKDSTPGCTREAQDFSLAAKKIASAGARVYGISRDSIASHCKFRDKYALKVPLLSDPDLVAHKAYGAWGEKVLYGKKMLGTIRSTFIVTPDGKVARVFPKVKVDGHADAVLEALRELKKARG